MSLHKSRSAIKALVRPVYRSRCRSITPSRTFTAATHRFKETASQSDLPNMRVNQLTRLVPKYGSHYVACATKPPRKNSYTYCESRGQVRREGSRATHLRTISPIMPTEIYTAVFRVEGRVDHLYLPVRRYPRIHVPQIPHCGRVHPGL